MHTGLKGDLSELIVLGHLLREGREVALPYGNRPGYDLLVKSRCLPNTWRRVQVKTVNAKRSKSGKAYCDFIRGSGSLGVKRRHYTKDDLDYLIAVNQETGEFWVFSADEVCGRRCASVSAGHRGYKNLLCL